jgi:predicted GTPase
MARKRVLILGAAGRDFHNFNTYYRDNEAYEVVAFTATQIPDIEGRTYPAELAGELYPEGIPILPEEDLEALIVDHDIDEAVFAYSDLSHEDVMHLASRVVAAGADYKLMGMITGTVEAEVPVVSVCAVRTGCGKSQTTRRVVQILQDLGKKVVVIRHPMPYGDLVKQAVQRFETLDDLDKHDCTIEEREEYEPHINNGVVVYAGVDYGAIVAQAEKEADIIVWDGGNNDLPLVAPDLEIVVTDPHRPGHEISYYPGEANLLRADVVVINKIDTASPDGVQEVRRNIAAANPAAMVIDAASPLFIEDAEGIAGKAVLVVEDGPTLTHGEMEYGAGVMAALKYGAADLVEPKAYAVGSILETYEKYPQTEICLPAMGYGEAQIRDLEATINATPADLVLIATPIDLRHLVDIEIPALRVRYELQEIGEPTLETPLRAFIANVDAAYDDADAEDDEQE